VIAAALRRIEPLLLASRSPQRRSILAQLGVAFELAESPYEERALPGIDPAELARRHAVGKARPVRGRAVLGVDTIVALDGEVLGKPGDEAEARRFLERLSGRTHTVHSGLCLRVDGVEEVRGAATAVTFAALDRDDVDWYLATREWRERAGAYAVQGRGAALVREIRGDYTNVVGLPVSEFLDAMGAFAH
jgi:septum formation protein